MADKAVSELIAAERINPGDMFVLEQNGTAKKLTGQVLLNWLFNAVDGHGGIKSIGKIKTVGLVDTYRITLSDGSTFDFTVKNGEKGDVGVFTTSGEKTNLDMGGYKVRNLGTPNENGDAVNLEHMNAAVQKARPRSLLDNSDFRNPVNERGVTNLAPGDTKQYCIDRWLAGRSIFSVASGGIQLAWDGVNKKDGYIQQILPTKMSGGEKLTLAFKCNGVIYNKTVTLTTSGVSDSVTDGIGYSVQLSSGFIYFAIATSRTAAILIEWAALYEGEYTAETLPEYQPKGYGEELAECQRYFRVMRGSTYLLGIRGYNAAKDVMVYFGGEMRVNPTVTLAGKSNISAVQGTTSSTLTSVSTIGKNYFTLVGDADLPERGPVGIYCNDAIYLSAEPK